VTAALVLPARTGLKALQKLERALALAADELERLTRAGAAGGAPARELDRALAEARSAAEPFTRGTFRVARATVELVHGASALGFYIRQLAVPGLLDAAERESHGEVATALGALASNARALTRALAGDEIPLAEVDAILEPLRKVAEVDPPRALTTVLLCLERLDHTIVARVEALLASTRSNPTGAR
jgi:hypothetical protein